MPRSLVRVGGDLRICRCKIPEPSLEVGGGRTACRKRRGGSQILNQTCQATNGHQDQIPRDHGWSGGDDGDQGGNRGNEGPGSAEGAEGRSN